MKRKKSIITKPKRNLSKPVSKKLIGKLSEISGSGVGESLYLRPFLEDEQMIGEIADVTDEKKSAVAQKLLHLALCIQPDDAARESRQLELLGWLAGNEKLKASERDVQNACLERLEEHALELEISMRRTEYNTRSTRIIVSEIYCLAIICMSFLNQIFTRLIEYFSPVEIEKNNSTDFANHNILGLVQHSLKELEKLSEYHRFKTDTIEPEMLYLFTKIEKIKARILQPSNKSIPGD
jgi:hypothetical protein